MYALRLRLPPKFAVGFPGAAYLEQMVSRRYFPRLELVWGRRSRQRYSPRKVYLGDSQRPSVIWIGPTTASRVGFATAGNI